MRASFLALALMLSAAWGVSGHGAEAGTQYMVEMDVWIDGERRGEPIVIVEPGEPASVEVGGAAGQEGWRVEVLVQPPASPAADLGGNIWLELAVYDRSEGELSLLADSLLGTPEGQPGVLSVVEAGREGQTEPSETLVHVTAHVSRLRRAERRD